MTTSVHLDALVRELATHGVHQYRVEPGGKHHRLVFEWRGREMFHIVSFSPSDVRTPLKAVSSLRRLMGVERVIAPKSRRPRRRHVPNRVDIPECPRLTVRPHPFAGLVALLPVDPIELRILLAEWRLSFSKLSFAEWRGRRASA